MIRSAPAIEVVARAMHAKMAYPDPFPESGYLHDSYMESARYKIADDPLLKALAAHLETVEQERDAQRSKSWIFRAQLEVEQAENELLRALAGEMCAASRHRAGAGASIDEIMQIEGRTARVREAVAEYARRRARSFGEEIKMNLIEILSAIQGKTSLEATKLLRDIGVNAYLRDQILACFTDDGRFHGSDYETYYIVNHDNLATAPTDPDY